MPKNSTIAGGICLFAGGLVGVLTAVALFTDSMSMSPSRVRTERQIKIPFVIANAVDEDLAGEMKWKTYDEVCAKLLSQPGAQQSREEVSLLPSQIDNGRMRTPCSKLIAVPNAKYSEPFVFGFNEINQCFVYWEFQVPKER